MKEILNKRRKTIFAESRLAFDFRRKGQTLENGLDSVDSADCRTMLPIPKKNIDIRYGKVVQNPDLEVGYSSALTDCNKNIPKQ